MLDEGVCTKSCLIIFCGQVGPVAVTLLFFVCAFCLRTPINFSSFLIFYRFSSRQSSAGGYPVGLRPRRGYPAMSAIPPILSLAQLDDILLASFAGLMFGDSSSPWSVSYSLTSGSGTDENFPRRRCPFFMTWADSSGYSSTWLMFCFSSIFRSLLKFQVSKFRLSP